MNKDRERMPGRVSDGRTRWFASMRDRSVYYARIAERTKCELFCLDSELDKMVEENAKWKSVVAAVRGVYSGPVTSCHTLHTGEVDFLAFLAKKDHWFYDLDFLSISYYCPARRKDETGKALTVDDMVVFVHAGRRQVSVRHPHGRGRGRAGQLHGGALPRVRARALVPGLPLVEVGPELADEAGQHARRHARPRFHVPRQEGRGRLPPLGPEVKGQTFGEYLGISVDKYCHHENANGESTRLVRRVSSRRRVAMRGA